MDTGPNKNDGALLSLKGGTIPMTGRSVGGSIADAFACAGGGFRLLLPILLIPVRSNPEFSMLTTFADVIVPDLPMEEEEGEDEKEEQTNMKTSGTIMSSILCSTVSLLAALLRADSRNLELFIHRGGVECLSWIFLRVPGHYITFELWESCKRLCFAMRDDGHGNGIDCSDSDDDSNDIQAGNETKGREKNNNETGNSSSASPSCTKSSEMPVSATENIDVFSSAVSCLLFDLRIWARGGYSVHGSILGDMNRLLSQADVSDAVDVQAVFDSLHDLYGGGYQLSSYDRRNTSNGENKNATTNNRNTRQSSTSSTHLFVRKGWNDVDHDDHYDDKSLWGIKIDVNNSDQHAIFQSLRNFNASHYNEFWLMLKGKFN